MRECERIAKNYKLERSEVIKRAERGGLSSHRKRKRSGRGVGAVATISGGNTMTIVKEYNGYGMELEKLLLPRTAPIAVKILEKEGDFYNRLNEKRGLDVENGTGCGGVIHRPRK